MLCVASYGSTWERHLVLVNCGPMQRQTPRNAWGWSWIDPNEWMNEWMNEWWWRNLLWKMRHGGLEFPSCRGCGNFGVCPIFMASCRPQLLASGFSTCSRYLEKRHQQHGSFAFESSRYKTQIYHGHILSFFKLFETLCFLGALFCYLSP